MKWCLPKFLADPFLKELTSERILELKDMIPADRHNYFVEKFGEEHGTKVNVLFEKKLMLKDFQTGMINWVKQLKEGTPERTKSDLISKILKLEKVLNPAEEKQFMHDLAAQSLGVEVTFEQAKRIVELAKIAKEKQLIRDATKENSKDRKKWEEFGMAVMELDEYANSISPKENSWYGIAMDWFGLPQALQTTIDFSFNMRQGWGLITTKEYWQNFTKQFGYMDEAVYKRKMAEFRGSPYFDQLKSDGLRLTELHGQLMLREEQMQTTLAEKIPVIGKMIKGFQQAYTARANEVRFNRAINLIEAAKLEGRDSGKGTQLSKDIMKVINDFSGSADLGGNDKYRNIGPLLNTVLYSARNLKATVNILNPYTYVKLDPFARKVALRQFAGSVSVAITILGLARLMGADVETDPRSAEFGKMKIGNTRIDFTGGKASLITLYSRLLTNKTKTISGDVVPLGERYGSTTRLDVTEKFIRTKLAPIPSFMADVLAGSNVVGDPVNTPMETLSDAGQRVYPMIVGDTLSLLKDEEYGKAFGITLLNIFGNNVSTYETESKKPL